VSSLQQKKSGRTYISQGDFAIDGGPDAVIATLLGSCISACIWDPGRGIGGMNHVLFVDDTRSADAAFGFGVNAMELLINGLLRLGADRRTLRAKVFGGARMIDGLSDAGLRNAAFVRDFLETEGIVEVGNDIGGTSARRVEFWPGTGRARLKYVSQEVPLRSPERAEKKDVELF